MFTLQSQIFLIRLKLKYVEGQHLQKAWQELTTLVQW